MGKSNLLLITREVLEAAILNGKIKPAYQPLVDLRSKAIVGFEVLSRWNDEKHGTVEPSRFIPIAEHNGLILNLSCNIIREACETALSWPGDFQLSFNLSPQQFSNINDTEIILETIYKAGFPTNRIQIEITEGTLLKNEEIVHNSIYKFKRCGICIALDDFGTGYTGLKQLHSFPYDKLKIDMSFVKSITNNSSSRKIVSSVIGLGQSLGMIIAAEGVETLEQAELLSRLGCDIGQGWLFGRPQNAEVTSKLLENHPHKSVTQIQPSASSFQRVHQLETLYEAAPIGLCLVDKQLIHKSVNSRFADMFSLNPDEMIGQTVYSFMKEHDANIVTNNMQKALNGETVIIEDYQPYKSDKFYSVIIQRVDDDDDMPIGVSVASIDITSYKNAERLLSQTEELARWTSDLSPNIPWSCDADGVIDFIGATPDATKITLSERLDDWMSRMDPVEYKIILERWLELLKLRSPFEITFRMKLRDNEFQWVVSRVRPHLNSDGNIVKWYGLISEVATYDKPHNCSGFMFRLNE